MTDILALDIATTTGWARGIVGTTPKCGSIRFGKDCSESAIFGTALAWASKMLMPIPRPDMLVMEAMLPGAAMKGETTRATRDRLAGLHGIIRGVANLRQVYHIEVVSVGDVRAHFIGVRNMNGRAAKREVMAQCQRMGWPATDLDAADACAVWSYACGIIVPETALQVSPLFQRRIAGTT